jgi:hypothetical protein
VGPNQGGVNKTGYGLSLLRKEKREGGKGWQQGTYGRALNYICTRTLLVINY